MISWYATKSRAEHSGAFKLPMNGMYAHSSFKTGLRACTAKNEIPLAGS